MITIVTDSTSYMSEEEAALLGVHVISMSYEVSGKLFNEGHSEKNGDFDKLLSQNIGTSSTSQVPVNTFMSIFDELIRQDQEVLCIVISSRLSGTYSSALVAAKQISSDKIAVIDSLTTAGGLYFLLKKASQLVNAGTSLHETVSQIEKMRNSVGVVFSVENMDALRKSGRIGIVRQSIGSVLNIRPILMLKDGSVISCASARGKNEQIKELISKISPRAKEIALHYISNNNLIEPLMTAVKHKFPSAEIKIHRLGPVLAIHLGLYIMGAAWFE